MIDTRYRVETPEGIDLQAQLAGPVPRMLAFSIDLAIRAGVLFLAMMVFGVLGWAMGILLVIFFLIEWFYPVFFEVLNKGQTPGKQILAIQVVNDDLTPVGWNTSVVRNLLRTVDILPMFYLGGLISLILTQHFQRLGDIAAGTLVVHREPQQKKSVLPAVIAQAPAIPLALEDQIAIIGFTERHQQLTESRQQELADILRPVHGLHGQSAVNYLHSVGRWLLGEKD
ncbi:RDD family protein [Halioxenophilus sp. WMMB6]|uniref:RDD family protein n=1 Tax=Halioxenophilus sp. WMMB6 TaxID=3073815 RepID=UPI00295E750F|nr:RDD family protein [Halioxenophilus sp. WMMB6]